MKLITFHWISFFDFRISGSLGVVSCALYSLLIPKSSPTSFSTLISCSDDNKISMESGADNVNERERERALLNKNDTWSKMSNIQRAISPFLYVLFFIILMSVGTDHRHRNCLFERWRWGQKCFVIFTIKFWQTFSSWISFHRCQLCVPINDHFSDGRKPKPEHAMNTFVRKRLRWDDLISSLCVDVSSQCFLFNTFLTWWMWMNVQVSRND